MRKTSEEKRKKFQKSLSLSFPAGAEAEVIHLCRWDVNGGGGYCRAHKPHAYNEQMVFSFPI